MNEKWGFLRKNELEAIKDEIDKDTGLKRTGLEKYLEVIFPEVNDWITDKSTGLIYEGKKLRIKPNYRSEALKLIVEFDGLRHYQDPKVCKKDYENKKILEELGYKVVRIPYFIQLTNNTVKKLFNVEVKEKLFNGSIPSLGPKGNNTPAYLCPAGIKRMAKEFINFKDQYEVNMNCLKNVDEYYLTEYKLLEDEYNKLKNNSIN